MHVMLVQTVFVMWRLHWENQVQLRLALAVFGHQGAADACRGLDRWGELGAADAHDVGRFWAYEAANSRHGPCQRFSETPPAAGPS